MATIEQEEGERNSLAAIAVEGYGSTLDSEKRIVTHKTGIDKKGFLTVSIRRNVPGERWQLITERRSV